MGAGAAPGAWPARVGHGLRHVGADRLDVRDVEVRCVAAPAAASSAASFASGPTGRPSIVWGGQGVREGG